MNKITKYTIGIAFLLLILWIIPLVYTIDIDPNKVQYSYGDKVVFQIKESNYSLFPNIRTFWSTCTKTEIYSSYEGKRSIIPLKVCWQAFTTVTILPFWSREYKLNKVLVPYTQKSTYYNHETTLYVWPGENIITAGNGSIKVNLPTDPIEKYSSSCSIYTDQQTKKSCVITNAKNPEECRIFTDEYEDYKKEECLKNIKQ